MKKNLVANLLCLICFGALASEKVPSSASRNDWALTSSAALDLPRYMGTWYEIAKYPNRFQKKCKEEAGLNIASCLTVRCRSSIAVGWRAVS